jgi:hypothetical protein
MVSVDRSPTSASRLTPLFRTASISGQRRCNSPQRRTSPRPLIVGAASEQQIVADHSSMQVKIWAELRERKLIEQDAPVPGGLI